MDETRQNETRPELNPCPFCGRRASYKNGQVWCNPDPYPFKIKDGKIIGGVWVACDFCPCELGKFEPDTYENIDGAYSTFEEAAGAWNRCLNPIQNLNELIERYHEVANALNAYRRTHGFEPGARVICRYKDEPEKKGVVAPYGDAWSRNLSHYSVPVRLEGGRLQPWSIENLGIVSAADSVQDAPKSSDASR